MESITGPRLRLGLGLSAIVLLQAMSGCITPRVGNVQGGTNSMMGASAMMTSPGACYRVAMPLSPPMSER